MRVNEEIVATVARLTRLQVDEADMPAMVDRMSRILDLVEQMQEVDTTGVAPLAHPLEAVQRLRDDVVTAIDERSRFQALAPEASDGLYLVPRVVE